MDWLKKETRQEGTNEKQDGSKENNQEPIGSRVTSPTFILQGPLEKLEIKNIKINN